MPKKNQAIPVNKMDDNSGIGITIDKMSFKDWGKLDSETLDGFEEATRAHREDHHSFFLLESGTVQVEIDFKKYKIKAPSIIYMHPDQVHRVMSFADVVVTAWSVNNENLNPEYLKCLLDITPAKPLLLKKPTLAIIVEAASLCIKISKRESDKLHHPLLRDSCNTLVALVISLYLEQSKTADTLSRFELITKAFKGALELNYTTAKRPADYARQLNISIPYLNECVKSATGYPVSYHIQQRIILEAKRLLHHSDRSVKEIAAELGYDDYPYFSRLFTKAAGMTALSFRNKNLV